MRWFNTYTIIRKGFIRLNLPFLLRYRSALMLLSCQTITNVNWVVAKKKKELQSVLLSDDSCSGGRVHAAHSIFYKLIFVL